MGWTCGGSHHARRLGCSCVWHVGQASHRKANRSRHRSTRCGVVLGVLADAGWRFSLLDRVTPRRWYGNHHIMSESASIELTSTRIVLDVPEGLWQVAIKPI